MASSVTPGATGSKVYVVGDWVVPGTTYKVSTESADGVRSASTSFTTPRWGDTAATSPPPVGADGIVDFLDITACVDAFKSLYGDAVRIEWTDVEPPLADQSATFLDITAVVDAFGGISYPYPVPPVNAVCPLPPATLNPYRFTGRALDFDFRDAAGPPLLTLGHYPREKAVDRLPTYSCRASEPLRATGTDEIVLPTCLPIFCARLRAKVRGGSTRCNGPSLGRRRANH